MTRYPIVSIKVLCFYSVSYLLKLTVLSAVKFLFSQFFNLSLSISHRWPLLENNLKWLTQLYSLFAVFLQLVGEWGHQMHTLTHALAWIANSRAIPDNSTYSPTFYLWTEWKSKPFPWMISRHHLIARYSICTTRKIL